jgi:hypothetical protein
MWFLHKRSGRLPLFYPRNLVLLGAAGNSDAIVIVTISNFKVPSTHQSGLSYTFN